MKEIIVVCPGGTTTGGIELLHQLVDSLIEAGLKSHLLYYPFHKSFDKPLAYSKYKGDKIMLDDVDCDSACFVLPETYTHLIKKFGPEKSVVWWMSVDNYISSSRTIYAVKNFLWPWNYCDIKKSTTLLKKVKGHLYQSEYAKLYLQNHGINNTLELSDYINPDYILAGTNIDYAIKEDIVVYNPAKGIDQTKKIIGAMAGYNFIPIVNMTRNEVTNLLIKAKVYIDFGNHPGKDRIPREAACLGCAVVTNRRGSALNSVDIPIAQIYKINDRQGNFELNAAEVLKSILMDFDNHSSKFDEYRKMITNEPGRFMDAVQKLSAIL